MNDFFMVIILAIRNFFILSLFFNVSLSLISQTRDQDEKKIIGP